MLSLQMICLNAIAKDFKRFYFAFKKANDKSFMQSFELLRRKYSFELLSKLFEKMKKLENEHLEIFLNGYLKAFEGRWLRTDNSTLLEDETFLTLTGDILCRLPNVTKIYFPDYCCDEDVRNIAKFCSKLEEIHVTDSFVTDNGIMYLCKSDNGKLPCPELKKLYIKGSRIRYDGIGIKCLLKNLPSLEIIDECSGIPLLLHSLHKEFPQHVYSLTSLDFAENGLFLQNRDDSYYTTVETPYCNDFLKICLTVCPKLKSLDNCNITDEQQLTLFSNLNLEKLDLLFSEIQPKINLNIFLKSNGYNLTSLCLESCIISLSDLTVSCPKLKCLKLTDVSFANNDESQEYFRCLVECAFCYANDDSSTDAAILFLLQSSPKLENVEFNFGVLSPDAKTNILKCCEKNLIKKISFMDTNAELNFLKSILLSCPSFMTLNVNDMDSTGLPDVKKLVELAETLPTKPEVTIYNIPATLYL